MYPADEMYYDAEENFICMADEASAGSTGDTTAGVPLQQRLEQLGITGLERQRAVLELLQQQGDDEEYDSSEESSESSEEDQDLGWDWSSGGVPGSRPEDYDHPSKIPKFMSKVDWYKTNSARVLHSKTSVTVLQAVVFLMAWKFDFGVTDAAFNVLLAMLAELFLPEVGACCCPALATTVCPP